MRAVLHFTRMSVLAIVLIVLAVLVIVLVAGGLVVSRRRLNLPDRERHIAAADQALEAARAGDRGWDRELMHAAARQLLATRKPGFEPDSLHLVLVDDRPGVEEDRAHFLAVGPGGEERLVLARDASGAWGPE